jgi:hypothetical protein
MALLFLVAFTRRAHSALLHDSTNGIEDDPIKFYPKIADDQGDTLKWQVTGTGLECQPR